MKIIFNTNEAVGGKSTTKTEDFERVGFEVERKRMENGDFFIPNINVLVESKTLSDGVRSMILGRLDEQIARLILHCNENNITPVLLVEDGYVNKRIYRFVEAFKDHLNSLSILLPVLRTNNQKHTAKTLFRMAEKGGEFNVIRRKNVVLDASSPELTVLCSIPTIGEELAKRILKKYKTVKNAISFLDEWNSVDGIGEGKMEKIKKCLEKARGW